MQMGGCLSLMLVLAFAGATGCAPVQADAPLVPVRGIYGGIPQEIVDSGRSLREFGVDAVWLGSGSFTAERLAWLRAQQVRVYAEFNTLHVADYLKAHPDAAPIGTDGRVSPAPDGWQGICPTHEGYRAERMRAFRTLLETFAIDGVWLDYHHSHASWEQAEPKMPDTCFCDRCLRRFQADTAIALPQAPTPERAALLLSTHRSAWVRWRLMSSPTGCGSSATSGTQRVRVRCSARSTTHGATTISAAPASRSSPST